MPCSSGKACDACSLRKVQCDGQEPCRRCVSSSFECTFLRSRGKPGPKGPRKRTANAIQALQSQASKKKAQSEEGSSIRWVSPQEGDVGSNLTIQTVHKHDSSASGDKNRENGFTDPTSTGTAEHPARIHSSIIAHYLNIHEFRAYSIWPVFNTKLILSRLLADGEDMEAYGFATALCAAAITSFQIKTESDAIPRDPVHHKMFESESKRARLSYDNHERMTLWSLLTSFFLHVYAANVGKKSTTALLLSEAVTMAHIIGLHKRSYYSDLAEDQQQDRLRVYWLLFISERSHSFQHETPATLHRALDLPPLRRRSDGSISANFMHLCSLFSSLDSAVSANSLEAVAVAQKQLNRRFYMTADGDERNEVQLADIFLTQQWMRVFLWQYSLSLTNLFSNHEHEEFSLAFPVQVAKTALGIVSSLSRESIEVHGPGMETKLFEITNSLADVMICVPSLTNERKAGLGVRNVIYELCKLLASFRGGNPAVINILRDKLVGSGLMVQIPERLMDYQESEEGGRGHYSASLL